MTVKRPVQGKDVAVTVVGPLGPALAGEFDEISLDMAHDAEEYMPLGSSMPIYLDGELRISGSLKRGLIDIGNLLVTMFGVSELQPGQNFTTTRFVITATFDAPDKGLVGRYSLTGCLIDKLSLSATGGKAVAKSDYSFKAEGIKEAA